MWSSLSNLLLHFSTNVSQLSKTFLGAVGIRQAAYLDLPGKLKNSFDMKQSY